MAVQPQIAYRDVEPSQSLERLIQAETTKLERFFVGIVSCRVLVEHSHASAERAKTAVIASPAGHPLLLLQRRWSLSRRRWASAAPAQAGIEASLRRPPRPHV
jgi:hypothetical protein